MSRRRKNIHSPTAVAVAVERGQPGQQDRYLRRSPRFLSSKTPDPSTPNSELSSDCRNSRRKQPAGSRGISSVLGFSDSGSSSPDSVLPENSVLRRSARLSLLGTKLEKIRKNAEKNGSSAQGGTVLGLEAEGAPNVCEDVRESKITGKRKRNDECSEREEPRVLRKKDVKVNRGTECVNGWTREQELVLQKAYFSEKPTPRFWKKVANMVPGKSAQDCFDKVQSEDATPPQPLRRSRAKKVNSSPIGSFSLSASKTLDPCGKTLKWCSTRQKHHMAQKTVRQLLEKHNQRDQVHEADLFSLLEPSAQDFQPSTPKNMKQKLLSLEKFSERSSSEQKKPISRFSNSRQPDIITPPVLKKVKDRFLHERYIDQLHCREAKRKKTTSSRIKKFTARKENLAVVQSNIVQKVDAIKTAKNALTFGARDAIDQLHRLQSDLNSDSSDCNGDNVDEEDDIA